MRCLALLSLFIFIITSCDSGKSSCNECIIEKKDSVYTTVFPIAIDTLSFALFYKTNELLGANPIIQAQSKSEWNAASKNKKPAWCYVDSLRKIGVLYNGYCLPEIEFENNFLLTDSVYKSLFEKETQSAIFDTCDSLFLVERNVNGNFYSVGYHSFWVRPEADSGDFNIISVNQRNREGQLRSVNPGNGYFIRLLK